MEFATNQFIGIQHFESTLRAGTDGVVLQREEGVFDPVSGEIAMRTYVDDRLIAEVFHFDQATGIRLEAGEWSVAHDPSFTGTDEQRGDPVVATALKDFDGPIGYDVSAAASSRLELRIGSPGEDPADASVLLAEGSEGEWQRWWTPSGRLIADQVAYWLSFDAGSQTDNFVETTVYAELNATVGDIRDAVDRIGWADVGTAIDRALPAVSGSSAAEPSGLMATPLRQADPSAPSTEQTHVRRSARNRVVRVFPPGTPANDNAVAGGARKASTRLGIPLSRLRLLRIFGRLSYYGAWVELYLATAAVALEVADILNGALDGDSDSNVDADDAEPAPAPQPEPNPDFPSPLPDPLPRPVRYPYPDLPTVPTLGPDDTPPDTEDVPEFKPDPPGQEDDPPTEGSAQPGAPPEEDPCMRSVPRSSNDVIVDVNLLSFAFRPDAPTMPDGKFASGFSVQDLTDLLAGRRPVLPEDVLNEFFLPDRPGFEDFQEWFARNGGRFLPSTSSSECAEWIASFRTSRGKIERDAQWLADAIENGLPFLTADKRSILDVINTDGNVDLKNVLDDLIEFTC